MNRPNYVAPRLVSPVVGIPSLFFLANKENRHHYPSQAEAEAEFERRRRAMDPSVLNNPRLKALIEEERTKAFTNELVAKLTLVCWDKCVTGSIGSSFSRSEASCLSNCTKRFAEVKMMTMQRFTGGS